MSGRGAEFCALSASTVDAALHEVGDLFAERNRFLQVVLGCLGYAQRFEDLLALQVCAVHSAVHSDGGAAPMPPRGGSERRTLRLFVGEGESSVPASDFVHFLLGGLALARSIRVHAGAASGLRDPAATSRAAGSVERRPPRELLL